MIGQAGDTYYIGEPLLERVHTFIAIAGFNYGNALCTAEISHLYKSCDKNLGNWGGSQDAEPWPIDMSSYFQDLNGNPQREAKNIYVIAAMKD
jgi:hypothetical protein